MWNEKHFSITITTMTERNIDIKKAILQHLAIDEFFAGDFGVRGNGLNLDSLKSDIPPEKPQSLQENKEAQTMPQASKTLQAISDEIKACKNCQLSETRKNTVPGDGNPNADLVFIGEAPGAEEDEQGIPFIGRSGQLLTNMINAMGLTREDVFICNIIKCRPPENRNPLAGEKKACIQYIQQQLAIIKPKVIVTLGTQPTQLILDTKTAIGQLRGRFHQYLFTNDLPDTKVMPTYHPSYLLRNYDKNHRTLVWQDLQKVMAELGLKLPQK